MANQQILIVAHEKATQKIRTFIRAAGGDIAASPLQDATTKEEAQNILAGDSTPAVALLHIPAIDAELTEFLQHLIGKSICPTVILTDDSKVISACKNEGYSHFIPFDDLTSDLLINAVHAAEEHFNLKQNHMRLDNMYQESEQRFKDVANQFADWLWEIDADLNIILSSSRKRPAQGAEPGNKFTSCFLPDEKMRVEDDFAALCLNPRNFQDIDYWSFDAYGTRMCWSLSGVPILNEAGKVTGFRGVAKDVSKEKSSVDQLYYLANNDHITGGYNRHRFMEELERTIRQSKREKRDGILAIINVDHFAYINDTHGHALADKLLVHISQIIQDNMRTGDVLGRVAGDEFAIIMPDVPKEDTFYRIERFTNAFNAMPFQIETGTVSFNVSVGASRFPHHGENADDIFANATKALVLAKEKGRGRLEVYSEEQSANDSKADSLEWMDFVSQCLNDESERMVLYYQPIVPLDGKGHKQFYEVLIRMLDNQGEVVCPVKFIGAAEEFGLVNKIDKIVANRSIDMLKVWQKEGREVQLSINISAKTFDDDEFLQTISEKLAESGLPPKSVIFEITETAILRDLTQVRNFMTHMRKAGAGFALDDCGVGYSSFNHIRHLDLDYIKIDGSFIRNLHISEEDDAFVEALHKVALNKSIITVAEMVENEAVAKKLKAMGIEYAQGFHYATPEPELPDEDEILN